MSLCPFLNAFIDDFARVEARLSCAALGGFKEGQTGCTTTVFI